MPRWRRFATVLGLAFRLYDPDGLLGGKKDIGITCALVPRDTPGANFGRRHFPLNAMFMNGPSKRQGRLHAARLSSSVARRWPARAGGC
jgi:alkylation response protein AidB-like acyl-CoA dehydrogenase